MGNMTQDNKITIKEAAELSGRSKSSIHRDIDGGKLAVAFRAPGNRGLILLDRETVLEAYCEH